MGNESSYLNEENIIDENALDEITGDVDIFARDNYERTILHTTPYGISIKKLLSYIPKNRLKETVNAKDKYDNTPLHYHKDPDATYLLIKAGADINCKNNNGRTPLHTQVLSMELMNEIYKPNVETIKVLLREGSEIDSIDKGGLTPLFYATDPQIVELLLKNGANVNITTGSHTPLHNDGFILRYRFNDCYFNYKTKDIKAIKILLDYGANVHSLTSFEQTPLHTNTNLEIVKLLIEYGANVNYENRHNENVLEYHRTYGDDELIELLINSGAKVRIHKYIHPKIRKVYLKILMRRLMKLRKLRKFVNLLSSKKGCEYFWNPNNLGGKWAKKSLSSFLIGEKMIL